MYLCVGAAWRTSGNSAVWAALCVLGDCSQNYLSNILARWGRERRTCVPPSPPPGFFVSLLFFFKEVGWNTHCSPFLTSSFQAWNLDSHTRKQHGFHFLFSINFCMSNDCAQHPPGLSCFWLALVGGVGELTLECEETLMGQPRLHMWNRM